MKLKNLSLACILAVAGLAGYVPTANAELLVEIKGKSDQKNLALSQINSVYELLEFQDRAKGSQQLITDSIQQQARLKQIQSYAYSLALNTALKSQLGKANSELAKPTVQRQLDTIYNFSPLMIQGRIIPPVIVESTDLYAQKDDYNLKIGERMFQIFSQAKFSSTAPNWREYLQFSSERDAYDLIAYGATGLEPKNEQEKLLWVKATEQGWAKGVETANTMLQNSLTQLNRDYIGMVRFHELEMTGRITMPIMRTYQLYDTNSGDRIVLNEKQLQIEQLPYFTDLNVRGGLFIDNSKLPKSERASSALIGDSTTINEQGGVLRHTIQNGQLPAETPYGERIDIIPKTIQDKPLNVSINREYKVEVKTDQSGLTVLDTKVKGVTETPKNTPRVEQKPKATTPATTPQTPQQPQQGTSTTPAPTLTTTVTKTPVTNATGTGTQGKTGTGKATTTQPKKKATTKQSKYRKW